MNITYNKNNIIVRLNTNIDFNLMPVILKKLYFRYEPIEKVWHRPYNSFVFHFLVSFSSLPTPPTSAMEAGEIKYKVPNYHFQTNTLLQLLNSNKKGLFLEMGLGKTKISIDYFNTKGYNKILILCPKAVIQTWRKEIEKFSYYPYKMFIGENGNKEKMFKAFIKTEYAIYITNYETVLKQFIHKGLYDLVIFDESSKLKHSGTLRFKSCFKLSCKDFLLLTGTPMTNSPVDIFNQFQFISPGEFGLSKFKFILEYCEQNYFKQVIGLKEEKEKEFKKVVYKHSIIIKKKEVLKDLPDKIYETRFAKMSKEHLDNYKKLEKEMLLEISGKEISPQNAAIACLRLRELCAGFYREQGQLIQYGDNMKQEALKDLIEEINQPVLIYYNFHPEKDMLIKQIKNSSLLEEYKKGEHLLLQSGQGYGLNLQEDFNHCIFFSQLYSREHRLQAEDRIYRIGTKTSPVIIDLLYERTIEPHIYHHRGDLIKTLNELLNKEEENEKI